MWLNSPAQSLNADGVSLWGDFGPEGADHLLVVSVKRHVDLMVVDTERLRDLYTEQGMDTLGATPQIGCVAQDKETACHTHLSWPGRPNKTKDLFYCKDETLLT